MAKSEHFDPKVTFIIPTLNAINHLPNLIESIQKQNYPKNKIEIIIADGGSTDGTIEFCIKNKLKIIHNPQKLHEPGKTLAAKYAHGDILFYTDADNVLVTKDWISKMVKPFITEKNVVGYLPQTVPPPNSHPLNQYLGFLFTDPFTWFVYGKSANPKNYATMYTPVVKSHDYQIFQFPVRNPPLFGLSQGVGTISSFNRSYVSQYDDLLAGLDIINNNGRIAYVPNAFIYHYHVDGWGSFISKYSTRIRNNLNQKYIGMGFIFRRTHLSLRQNIKAFFFIPYAFSLVFPLIDSVILTVINRDTILLYHVPTTILLAGIMTWEILKYGTKKIFHSLRKLCTIY